MTRSSMLVASATLAAIVMAGCSDAPAATRVPGQLPSGTAEVSIDGANPVRSTDAHCRTDGFVTAVDTGTETQGTSSTVKIADGLTALSVQIRDVDGFTGSSWKGLGQATEATMTGRVYTFSGTATGFADDRPGGRIPRSFEIRASC